MQQAQGELAAALTSYQASHDIFERLAKADPGNAGWQRDLSVSHNNIGNVQRAQGDLPAALTSYQAARAIAERLAKADPPAGIWSTIVGNDNRALTAERLGRSQQSTRNARTPARDQGEFMQMRESTNSLQGRISGHVEATDERRAASKESIRQSKELVSMSREVIARTRDKLARMRSVDSVSAIVGGSLNLCRQVDVLAISIPLAYNETGRPARLSLGASAT